MWKKLQARSSLKLNSSFFRNEVPSHLKWSLVLELFVTELPIYDTGRIFELQSPPPFLAPKWKYAKDSIKEQLWSARWKIITLKSNLNKCSNLSQPLDKLNLVGRLIATLHWFLTACWWKFWKRIERWKTWHLSNILHPDHVPTNAQSIFFFTLSWTTSSQPLGAGQWIVRSRQFASWATRSTRSDLTKSFYLKQTKLTANLSFWRIICTDKRNMFLLVFSTSGALVVVTV